MGELALMCYKKDFFAYFMMGKEEMRAIFQASWRSIPLLLVQAG
jgi:hypothetical protein